MAWVALPLLQLYPVAPVAEAISVAVCPLQMLSAGGTIVTTGTLLTVTVALEVAEQPPKSVTVNV